jgi:hypothetical protein
MESRRKWPRILISGFILFHMIAIPLSTSRPKSEQSLAQRIVMPYLKWTRLNQHWPLFSPTPRTYAKRYRVDIAFHDGSMTTWRRPYPPNWDFFERHLAYNYQKWDLAAKYLDQRGPLWDDLAHYIEHRYHNEQNPPEVIALVLEMADWQPPNETGWAFHENEEASLKWNERRLFTYHVADQRLE